VKLVVIGEQLDNSFQYLDWSGTIIIITIIQGDYTHRHNQLANITYQELTIKRGLSKGKPILYYRYEPQSVLEKSYYELYYDRSITTDQI
jgi:hypothetical protein